MSIISPDLADLRAGPPLRGAWDGLSVEGLVGWLLRADAPEQPVSVEVLLDGERLGTTTTSLPRPELDPFLGVVCRAGFVFGAGDVSANQLEWALERVNALRDVPWEFVGRLALRVAGEAAALTRGTRFRAERSAMDHLADALLRRLIRPAEAAPPPELAVDPYDPVNALARPVFVPAARLHLPRILAAPAGTRAVVESWNAPAHDATLLRDQALALEGWLALPGAEPAPHIPLFLELSAIGAQDARFVCTASRLPRPDVAAALGFGGPLDHYGFRVAAALRAVPPGSYEVALLTGQRSVPDTALRLPIGRRVHLG